MSVRYRARCLAQTATGPPFRQEDAESRVSHPTCGVRERSGREELRGMRTEAHRWPTRPSENQDSKLSRQTPSCQDQVWESTHNCSGVNSRLELPSWSICTWRKLCVVTQRLGRPEVTGVKLSPHLAKFVTRKETALGTFCPASVLFSSLGSPVPHTELAPVLVQ